MILDQRPSIAHCNDMYPSENHVRNNARPLVTPSKIDIERHRRLLNLLRSSFYNHEKYYDFSPLTARILLNLSDLTFIPAFLLAHSLCRFNELDQIKLSNVLNREPFHIISSKGGHTRLIPPVIPPIFKNQPPIHDRTKLQVVSYFHLCREIKRCLPPEIKSNLKDNETATHVFRHIEATAMYFHGIPIELIAEKMGHYSTATSRVYIHYDEFSNLFDQL